MSRRPIFIPLQHLRLFILPLFLVFISLSTVKCQIITGKPPQFSKFPQPYYAPSEGSEFSLKCPLLTDNYQVDWYKDGESLGKTARILLIPSISRIDSGIYRCYAHNGIGGAYSPSVNVSVSYFDGFQQVPESFYHAKVPSNGYFVLKPPPINASPNAKLTWVWKFEEQEIFTNETHYVSANGDLIILEAAKRFGIYLVEVESEKNSAVSLEYTVEEDFIDVAPPNFGIVYRPKDVLLLSDTNTSATFECVPTLWNRFRAEIRWFLNGNELTVDDLEVKTEFSNRQLILPNAVNLVGKSSSSSKISCEARTSDKRLIERAEAKLEIYQKPIINHEAMRKEIMKKIGDHLRIECKTSQAWPRAKYTWYLNKNKLPNFHKDRLRIERMDQSNFGVYQCEAINQAGSDIAAVWVKTDDGQVDQSIQEEAIFDDEKLSDIENEQIFVVKPPEVLTSDIGKDIVLTCETADPHKTTLSWTFNGSPIPQNDPRYLKNSTSLMIHAAKKSDSGLYECLGRDANGREGKALTQVNVNGTKLIEYGPQDPMNQLIGTNVLMPCKVYDEFADRNVIWTVWYRNGQEIPSTGDLQRRITINADGSLAINQVGPDNIGLYKCTVRSSKGDEESVTAWLHIIEKPSMPQAVTATIVNDTVPVKIRVSWKPGFDGNSPLLKHSIEMRTVGPMGFWSDWENAYDNVPTELCCTALIDNIKPSATAEFRVIAYNKYGAGKPSRPSHNITMPQQPPAAAPRNVAASARSSSSVMVQWQQPPPEQWNGEVLGYMIRYRLAGYATAGWNEVNVSQSGARNHLIEPLITWREYEIQVAAYNERGCGVYSKPIEVTTLEGVPMQSPQNVEIRVLSSTEIRVSFDPPDQQMIPGVNLGYKIELWKGPVGVGSPYKNIRVYPDPMKIVQKVDSLEKFGHYNLTVLCFTAPGDGPRSDPISVITDEDVPGPVASVTFDMVMFSSVVVIWEEPTEPNGIILKYIIRHWEEANPDQKMSIEVSALARNHTIEDLKASTKYMVDVQAVTKKGPGPRVEAKFESGVPPELPGRPSSLAVSDIGPRSAVLQFVPGFDGHSYIKRWIVEARVGSSSIFTTIFNISAPKARSFTVESLRPYTKYQLRLIAENVRGRGAPSDPTRPFETRQAEPEIPPEKVFAEPISDNQISLSWTPLMPYQWNGDPSGYLIQYRAARNVDLTNIFDEDVHEWKEIRTPNSKASELTLSDLRPHTDYQIRVFAENTFGRSSPSTLISTRTYESVPSGAPTEVIAEIDQMTRSLKVSWSDIEERHKNGIILGYYVKAVPEEQNLRQEYSQQIEVVGAKQHEVDITDLRPYTTYRIFVSGFTIVGEGPENSEQILVTTPEDLPEEPADVQFGSVSDTEFMIRWTPPENPNGKIKSYDLICWHQDEPKENGFHNPFPHNVFSFLVMNRKPNTTHSCAIKVENDVGWGPERVVQVFTNESLSRVPLPVPPVPTHNKNRPESSTEIWLTWTPSNTENIIEEAPVRYVKIEYKRANQDWDKYEKTIPADKNEAHIKNLIPNMAYKFRIKYKGDFQETGWSSESDWIKTLGAPPSKPPTIQANPYETSSALVQWTPPDRSTWGSDMIGYKILYKVYMSNDSYKSEEIPMAEKHPVNSNGKVEQTITKLASFKHYIVQVQAFNYLGNSHSSRPAFVYVGYSIPKQTITGLSAEGLSSTSLRVTWDAWKEKEDDFINGYRIRYAPMLSVLSPEIQAEASGGESTEEVVISENNEIVLSDLRKYTEYQVSVAGYNRAGEGQTSTIRIKTLEDTPGPVGDLIFQDILLDSVNVSWTPPVEPNGRILGYIVNYHTYKLSEDFRKDIQEKTQLNYFLAENLEENTTYFFTVRAQTSAGDGIKTAGNVTTGYNKGAPEAPERPIVVPEQSTFMLRWRDGDAGFTPIKGHVIQAKRVGTAINDHLTTFPTYANDGTEPTPAIQRMKRQIDSDFRPRHVIGEWVTISNVLGPNSEHKISYRQLEPSSYYVFRLFATNTIGIGKPSPESEQLFVPASLPEEPFYTKWWFLVIVGLLILIVVIIFVATLCLTTGNSKYKGEKRGSFDSLQLADGAQVAYELRQSQKTNKMRRSELPSRPPTHTSWLSAPEPVRNADVPGYGSIASGLDVTNSMYRALATDAMPNNSPPGESKRNSALSTSNGYASRRNLNLVGGGGNRSKSPGPLKNDFHESSTYRLSDFNANRRLVDENPYGAGAYDYDRSDSYNERQSPEQDAAESFARHYEFGNANDEIYRATWRRTRAQAEQQQRTPLPQNHRMSKPSMQESSVTSNETQQNGSEMSEPINAAGILLRSNYSSEISSPAQHPNAPHNIGNSVINGFSSFV